MSGAARPILMDGEILFASAEEAAERLCGLAAGVRQAASGRRRKYLGHTFAYASGRGTPERVALDVVLGGDGPCLLADGARIAGPDPRGGGKVVVRFDVAVDALRRELDARKT